MFFRVLVILSLMFCALLSSCSRCNGEPPLKESQRVEGSATTPWEKLPLENSPSEFKRALASIAGIIEEELQVLIKCADQVTIDVIDPKSGTISERVAGDKTLSNCVLFQAQHGKSWKLVSARGDFVNDSLASVSLNFSLDDFELVKKEIEARFGPGDTRKILEHSILGEQPLEMIMWSIDKDIWALGKTTKNVKLLHQNTAVLRTLPTPSPASKRGKPVNLDNIGLGGALDLDEPLPEIPTLDLN